MSGENQNQINGIMVAIAAIIAAIIGAVAMYLGSDLAAVRYSANLTRAAETAVAQTESTQSPQNSEGENAGKVVTRIVEVPITSQPEIVIISATPLPLPTDTPGPTPTLLPTNTPKPTNTPTPTTTPIPPMELPFSDDFSDDVDERWTGHNDNYIISGGVLKIKDGDVRFTLKGPLPEKYNIDFGYVNGRYRIILGNQLSLVTYNGTRWEEFRDGKFVRLEGLEYSDTNSRIRIEVDGKVHRLFFDGIEQPEFIYNNEAGGDLVVELLPWNGATGLTDFEISEP